MNTLPSLTPDQAPSFSATRWHGADKKQRFVDHFKRFVSARMPENLFHEWFYSHLNHIFGHIAHYDKQGFYQTWFATAQKQHEFIEHALRARSYGDPEYTWSDVERYLQTWLQQSATVLRKELEYETQERHLAAIQSVIDQLPEHLRKRLHLEPEITPVPVHLQQLELIPEAA